MTNSEKNLKPVAARVSEAVGVLGFDRFNFNVREPGFRCSQWVNDEYGNPTVKVEWFMGEKPDVGLGRKDERRIAAARRDKYREIKGLLEGYGYNVVWGWDPENGEPDTTFIVVISKETAERDAEAEVEEEAENYSEEPEDYHEAVEAVEERLQGMTISLKEANEAALAISRAYNVGRDEAARRMEHQLMKSVLSAIVYGTDEAVDLAAVALSMQHLPFAR